MGGVVDDTTWIGVSYAGGKTKIWYTSTRGTQMEWKGKGKLTFTSPSILDPFLMHIKGHVNHAILNVNILNVS